MRTMPTIVIGGYYGAGNVGDEAILQCMLSDLRELSKEIQFFVISWDPDQTKQLYAVESVHWKDLTAIIAAIKNADLVLLGGGGLFQDYWGIDPATYLRSNYWDITAYGSLPLLAKLNGIPAMIYAVGLGPLKSDTAIEHTKFAFENATLATMRDQESLALLLQSGYVVDESHPSPRVYADPAFSLRSSSDEIQQAKEVLFDLKLDDSKKLLAVNLRYWDLSGSYLDWVARVSEGIRRFLDRNPDFHVLLIPFQSNLESKYTNDLAPIELCARSLANVERVQVVNNIKSPGTLQALFHQCQLILGMRMHSLIMGINAGVPVIGLPYDPKVVSLMKDAGLQEYCFSTMSPEPEEMSSKLEKALKDRNQILIQIKKFHESASRKAKKNAEVTINLLGSQEKKAVTIIQSLALEQANVLIVQDKRIDELSTEVGSLQESIRSLDAKISENQEYQSILLDEKQKLESERNSTVSKLENLFDENQALISKLDLTNSELESQTEKSRDLRDQLNSIYSSKAWKLISFYYRSTDKFPVNQLRWSARFVKRQFLSVSRDFSRLKYATPGYFSSEHHLPDLSHVIKIQTEISRPENTLSKNGAITQVKSRFRNQISLISVVKNEVATVDDWFERILNQTRLPDEIIIVDGWSTDGTKEKLIANTENCSISIRILDNPNGNIASNRNLAIKNARHSIIAVTDFGCFPRTDWLEKIVQPFEEDNEIVVSAGTYAPIGRNKKFGFTQRKLWHWSKIDKIDPQSYLPPGGSIAFQKSAWQSVGGYPEWLTLTGEDTYFDLELKNLGGKWAFVPESVVEWEAPETLISYLKKMHQWAIGDGESGAQARYYWQFFLRQMGWFTFTLAVIGLIALINIFHTFPQVLWTVMMGLIYLAAIAIISKKNKLNIVLTLQKFLGEIVQTAGFMKGARRRKEIEKRRLAAARGIIFMLAGVPIDDTGGGSRGAQISLEFIRQGYAVVYIHQYPKLEKRDLNLRLAHPNLFQIPFSKFNLENFLSEHPGIATHPNKNVIIEFPLPGFLPLVKKVKTLGGRVLYDSIDNWQSSLGWDWYSYEDEVKLIQECDMLTATVPNLVQRLQQISHKPVGLVPNAVNDRMFNPEVKYLRPRDLPERRRVIIYTGALWGDWFDWELLGKVAETNPRAIVCVIGDYRGQYINPPSNLIFLGLKAQNELPAYLAYADVAIIPWKDSAITQSTSPLKVYEYLAMRVPVIAPDLEPLKDLPDVYLAKDHADFLKLVEGSEKFIVNDDESKKFIKLNNWESRVRQLISILEEGRPKVN